MFSILLFIGALLFLYLFMYRLLYVVYNEIALNWFQKSIEVMFSILYYIEIIITKLYEED
ncbi:hypothetical protein A8L44_04440 [Bacillus sp. FJAT-27986]|nr:hypothetical protein A8L44_04440 [Bacillus sp. FJAT-27986]